jgi:ATP-dependent protease ClpP protease subunit
MEINGVKQNWRVNFMSAEEAKAYGLVDEVLSKRALEK